MIDAFARLADAWPAIATVLSHSQQPWPEAAIQADWVWLQGQVEVGTLRSVPGRRSLAKRWGWRENRVRLFLDLEAVGLETVRASSAEKQTRFPGLCKAAME